jgi:hypothetical protein
MRIQEALALYRTILIEKMGRKQEKEEAVEIMLLIVIGMVYGLYNVNQISEQLDITPKPIYQKLKEISKEQWQAIMGKLMIENAIEKLKNYQQKSEATKSRQQASMSVDDSLIKRLGKYLSYVWSWYSGQIHRVTRGQDLLGIVMKIDNEIIPLSMVLVSKQGRANTNKPDILIREIKKLKALFEEAQIDITNLGISFDSWWLNTDVSAQLKELGFHKQIICAKQTTQLKVGRKKQSLVQYYFETDLQAGWGHQIPAARLKGTNPTFGDVVVVLFEVKRSKAFALFVPAHPLRTCETLRIWANHSSIETFWKRLKHWLGLGKMQLQNANGAWADIALHIIAYFFATDLLDDQFSSLAKLSHHLRRYFTFPQFICQHFHPLFLASYGISLP